MFRGQVEQEEWSHEGTEPLGQAVQEDEPLVLMVPEGQDEQEDAPAWEYCPAGHGLHCPETGAWPAGQFRVQLPGPECYGAKRWLDG